MEQYVRWLQDNHKKSSTFLTAAVNFRSWYSERTEQQVFDPKHIRNVDIEFWLDYLLNEATFIKGDSNTPKKYDARTIQAYSQCIKSYFTFLYECKQITSDLYEEIKQSLSKAVKDPVWLSEEKDTILDYFKEESKNTKSRWTFTRNRAILYASLFAGLTTSEILRLRIKDLNVLLALLSVQSGIKIRRIEIEADLMNALLEWITERGDVDTDCMFISNRSKPLTDKGVWSIYNSMSHSIGVANLSPQLLKNTHTRDLYERGYSVAFISEITGQSLQYIKKISSTQNHKNWR
ncbi:tyrosine-type recombinase/integrase [Paenibacillus sp. NPDC093718]|uniref:tyrosine-type recombinase/integrase n=1 Tax=Paenibacillus sp. NPDC093718 TaxID=3390601 RepID=UPI003D007610